MAKMHQNKLEEMNNEYVFRPRVPPTTKTI